MLMTYEYNRTIGNLPLTIVQFYTFGGSNDFSRNILSVNIAVKFKIYWFKAYGHIDVYTLEPISEITV